MSNRNFDASTVAARLRDKNVAQQIFGAMRNGRAVGNPQTVNANASIMPEYNEGVETVVEKGLRAGYTFDLGGIANYVTLDQGGGGAPAPPPATVPGAPTITLVTPGNASIVVDFTPPSDGGSPLTLYEYVAINQSIIFAPEISGTVIATPSLSQLTVPGLTNGNGYTVKLRAQNSVGWGAYSAESAIVVPSTTPGAPTGVSATAGDAQATISFTPGSNGGIQSVTYTVTSNPGGFTATGGASPITVTGLTNGTAYTFTVIATTIAGSSSSSTLSNSVTPATVPSAPSGVSAVAGNGEATISFTPEWNGGSAITSYTVTSDPDGITAVGYASPITVTGLTNGTPYTFTIVATNDVGSSTSSDPSSPL